MQMDLEEQTDRKRSHDAMEECSKEDGDDQKRPRTETEESKPCVRPPVQLNLIVKPWQPVIIPPSNQGCSDQRETDIHLVIRMLPRPEKCLVNGTLRPDYPSPYDWPEPNVLGRLDELGIPPCFWNPWTKVIGVDDVMFAVCKCYRTEASWVQERIKLTQDDIDSIETWITKDRWKLSYGCTGKLDELRQVVIQCLILAKERDKLETLIRRTENPTGRRDLGDTMSILYLSQLPVKTWYLVGLGLGVEKAKLDEITNKDYEEEECVVVMFDEWLRKHAREACRPPMKLAAVLLDVGEMESAAMVCEKYDVCGPNPPVTLQYLCLLPLVGDEWREVGKQLGVTKKELTQAECDESQQGMFRCWLKMGNMQTWGWIPGEMQRRIPVNYVELIKALYAVGDPELAEEIIRKFKILDTLNSPAIYKHEGGRLMIDWNKLGCGVGFKGKNLVSKKQDVFETWLKRNRNATWEELVHTLSAVGDHEGARTLCRKHGIRLPEASVVALYGRLPINRQPQIQKPTSNKGPSKLPGSVSKDEKPTLPLLLKFPKGSDFINIPQKIGNCSNFGTFLLDDATGERVEAITKEHRGNTDEINKTILQKWLTGQGQMPITWGTLVEVLRDSGLRTLANDVENELKD